jgi:hypothetical protein
MGGCQPAFTQFLRTITAKLLFNRNASIVARPQAVIPIISVPFELQLKCSFHCCLRGLNKEIVSPD